MRKLRWVVSPRFDDAWLLVTAFRIRTLHIYDNLLLSQGCAPGWFSNSKPNGCLTGPQLSHPLLPCTHTRLTSKGLCHPWLVNSWIYIAETGRKLIKRAYFLAERQNFWLILANSWKTKILLVVQLLKVSHRNQLHNRFLQFLEIPICQSSEAKYKTRST